MSIRLARSGACALAALASITALAASASVTLVGGTMLDGNDAATRQPTTHPQPPVPLPDGEGKALVERACSQCHSLETVTRTRRTRKQWEALIDQMISKGAKLSDDDIDVVAAYLAKHFGPG